MELEHASEVKQQAKPRQILTLVALILSLVAIVGVLLLVNEFKNDWRQIREDNAHIAQSVLQLSELDSSLQGQLQGQENKLETLNDTLQHLSQMMGPVENGLLIQAEYLAQLAQLSLKYQGDVSGALALLKMADQRLSALSFPAALEVRQLLAKNITALQAVPSVDLAGVIVKLNALSEDVTQLPLVPSLPRTQPVLQQPRKSTKLDTYLTDWKGALATSWRALERVVIIRRHGQPIEPLLAPDEFLYLKQNIQLQLQQAQWAALHQQQAIYVASLQRAASWVNHYFTDNGLLSRAVQQNLGELEKVVVQPKVPDISAIPAAIRHAQQVIVTGDKAATPNKAGAH